MFKRIFDILFSLTALIFLGLFIAIFWILASIDTKSNGFFLQKRVGQFGKIFIIFKLKSIQNNSDKISKLGFFLRKSKIDELPQLLNVLIGDMSIVGPRPDIVGYYDQLFGENRKILNLKPGITSAASIKYANEDEILSQQENSLHYNDTVIFPDKITMNLDYFYNQSFFVDLKIIFNTIFKK